MRLHSRRAASLKGQMKICINLDDDILESLQEYADANKLSVPQMVELAVLEKHFPQRFAEKIGAVEE